MNFFQTWEQAVFWNYWVAILHFLFLGAVVRLVTVKKELKNVVGDVAELRKMEAQLRLSKEKFSRLFYLSPDAIAVVRLSDGCFLEVNDKYCSGTGRGRAEIIGRTALELNIWQDNALREQIIAELQSGGEVINREFWFRRKDGVLRLGLFSASTLDIDGERCFISVIRGITEYKRLEEELRMSKEKFADALQLNPDFVTISRLDSSLVAVNDGFIRITGYSREEAVGQKALELGLWVDPRDRERLDMRVRCNGVARDVPVRYRRKDGNVMYGLTACRRIYYNGEECTLGMVRDVTEQKLDEVCENILRQVTTQILAGMSLDKALQYACEGLADVFDLSLVWMGKMRSGSGQLEAAAGVLAQDFAQLAAGWDDEADRAFHECLAVRYGKTVVVQTRDRFERLQNLARARQIDCDWEEIGSTAIFPLTVQGTYLAGLGLVSRQEYFWDGRTIARLDGFVGQLTVAVNAAQNQKKLALLRTGLQTVHSAITLVDKNGNFEWTNPAFAKLTGYDYSELIGESARAHRFSLNEFEQAEATYLIVEESLAARGEWHGEVTAWRKDGSSYPAELTVTALRNEGGEIVNTIGVFNDITERKQAMEAMLEAKEARVRAEKLFSLGALSAGLSHEINQPLNSIKMIASGITYAFKKGKQRDAAEIMPQIEEISQQANRINNIISQLGVLTKRGDAASSLCSINTAVEQALWNVRQQMDSRGIKLNKDLAIGLPPVLANITSLEQIIVNLVVNAMQALDTVDRPRKEITVRTYYDSGVVVSVNDNGPGISAEAGRKVFEPFFSSKQEGDNLGLGLSIVNSLVSCYKGDINFESDGRNGAEFVVRFPAAN